MRGSILRTFMFMALVALLAGCAPTLDTSDSGNQISVVGAVGSGTQPGSPNVSQTSLGASGSPPFVRSPPAGVEPFPLVLNHSVQAYVDGYLGQPEGLERSFKRSRPYMAEMISLLQDRGLPADLVYLSFAESGFSSDGAGPWQLSRSTARRFGLTVNRWVDERRDPIKSTRAAADYLTALHEQTGSDWRMTLVAWNNGESGVDRYMNLRDASYERLINRLPRRTRSLLNRFMAVALIARRSRENGVERAIASGNPSSSGNPSYRVVAVRGGTPLHQVAQREHTSLETLRLLNPGLLRGCTPPVAVSYPVRVPQAPVEASL